MTPRPEWVSSIVKDRAIYNFEMTQFSEDGSSGKANHAKDKPRDEQYEHQMIGIQIVARYDKIASARFLCCWFIVFKLDVRAALLADSHLEPSILLHSISALSISI